ncbi:MAG: dephospho-CoA kinase, partial [Croceivirga sp.]
MIVGLTGGIGSGKSTVANFFRALGVPVYDSDSEAKHLMVASETIRNSIISLFGPASYEGQKLNKTYLSDIVFNDSDKLEQLNAIVHPAVRKHFLNWAKVQNTRYVLQETALLFENNLQHHYDKVILVTAPKTLRIRRVMKRDGVSETDVCARIDHQLSDAIKSKMADFI